MASTEEQSLRESLLQGQDALGDSYIEQFTSDERRASGSTYTPLPIVSSMVEAARQVTNPAVVVDCGCGSGRFAIACAKAFPTAKVYAVDDSSVACEMCFKNVAALGLEQQVQVINEDFTKFVPERAGGPTLWIGNPPYIRHHGIDSSHKRWFSETSRSLDVSASLLSGMHAYFLARIAELWHEGDSGILITSAEWLDVNYGSFMRALLLNHLGLGSIELFNRYSRVFIDAETTATIFSFGKGFSAEDGLVRVRLHGHEWSNVYAELLRQTNRWSHIVLGVKDEQQSRDSLVPLGTIASVHRGVVTGDNAFWVRDASDLYDIPEEFKVPVVSHAREIMGDCPAQRNPDSLQRLLSLPRDLCSLEGEKADAAERIIIQAEERGVQDGYVASHRKPWWSITPPNPPAIMMTYMARRTPSFVVNEAKLPMLNVIHGIYPKEPMTDRAVAKLTKYLNESTRASQGRMYSGGLIKFEPKEAEAILVPPLEELEA